MRTRMRGWRWRQNPLRRSSDVVEAWTALVVAVLLCVGAPLAGALVGLWAHDQARAVATVERAERHRVRAVVVGSIPEQLPSVQGGDREHAYQVDVRWSEPGKGARTAPARVPAGTRTGDVVDVWFDRQGHGVAPPPTEVAVWQHAVTVGICGASGAAAVVLLGHGVVRRVALRHRLAEWEQEWARTGPDWTRGRA